MWQTAPQSSKVRPRRNASENTAKRQLERSTLVRVSSTIYTTLAKGRTVLFVSETLAALEVVRRRLDDAGLGLFCREVHSHVGPGDKESHFGRFSAPRQLGQKKPKTEDVWVGLMLDPLGYLPREISL
jgi:hypothetical protein